MKFSFTISILLLAQINFAQTDCPCCTEHHKAFNFWVGDWVVKDTSGNTVGINSISVIQDSCALQEKWTGKTGSTGTSLNYFNPADSTWNQLWMDNSGGILKLKGHLKEEQMILSSGVQEDDNLGKYKNQISWTPRDDGSVIQKWDMINRNGEIIKTVFYGIYLKRK